MAQLSFESYFIFFKDQHLLLYGEAMIISQRSKAMLSVIRTSELNCEELQCLDYNFLSLQNWTSVLPGFIERFFSIMNFNSLHLFFWYQCFINLFSKPSSDHMQPARQSYSPSWHWNVLQSDPCVIISCLIPQLPSSIQRLTKMNERFPPAQLKTIFMGTVSGGHEAELEMLKKTVVSGHLLSNF